MQLLVHRAMLGEVNSQVSGAKREMKLHLTERLGGCDCPTSRLMMVLFLLMALPGQQCYN